jgi:hypothetical protein
VAFHSQDASSSRIVREAQRILASIVSAEGPLR